MPKYVFKYVFLLSLLILHFLLLFNLQFTAWPEMLSYAYLRNNDFLLYKDMIHPYPPVLTIVLSLVYKLFGYHLWVLQAVAWFVILAGSFLVFLIIKNVTKRDSIALAGLALYVFLQPFLEGNMLWFDIAIVPLILLALLFILQNNLVLSGFFLALGMLTKQTVGVFYIFILFYLLFVRKLNFNQLKYIFLGPMIFGLPLLVRLLQEGALVDFVNWVLLYPMTRWGAIVGYVQMELGLGQILILGFLCTPFLIGIVLNRAQLKDKNFMLLVIFLAAALVSVYPRFSFFHFQTALAVVIITTVYILRKWETKYLAITFVAFLVILSPIVYIPVLSRDWQKQARFYGNEDVETANKIRELVPEDKSVFLFGLQSNLYTLSNRVPPKRWSDNFAWYLEIPGVQEEILARWEKNPPYYVVRRTPEEGNWFDLGTYQPKKIASWIEANYTRKGEITPNIWLWVLRQTQD